MREIGMDCACMGKNLDKMLQPSVLRILYYQPMHGFAIASALRKGPMCCGTMPDPAGVYRYLKRMESSGLLTSRWGMEDASKKPVRVYEITPKGRICLMNWKIALSNYKFSLEKLIDEIDEIGRNHSGGKTWETEPQKLSY